MAGLGSLALAATLAGAGAAAAWEPAVLAFPLAPASLANACTDLSAEPLNVAVAYENTLDPNDPATVRGALAGSCLGCHGNVTGVVPPESDGQLNLDEAYQPAPLANLLGASGLGEAVRRQPSPWLRIDVVRPNISMLYLMTNCIPPAPYPSDPPRVMPPNPLPPLTNAQRALIYDWIVEGARGEKTLPVSGTRVPASDVIFRSQLEGTRLQ